MKDRIRNLVREGSIPELKNFVEENSPDRRELEHMLVEEKLERQREEAVEFLKEELREDESAREIGTLKVRNVDGEEMVFLEVEGTDIRLDKEPGLRLGELNLELGIPERDDILPGLKRPEGGNGLSSAMEDVERDRLVEELRSRYGLERDLSEKSVEELKRIRRSIRSKRKSLLEKYDVPEMRLYGKNLVELRELEKELRESGKEESGNSEDDQKPAGDREEKSEEETSGEEESEEAEKEEEQEEDEEGEQDDSAEEPVSESQEIRNELSRFGFDEEELEDKELAELRRMRDEYREKKDIVDELDEEFKDEKLRKIGLDQLRELRREKKEREDLIEFLENRGMDRERLENASTPDLRKLRDSVTSGNQKELDVLDRPVEEVKERVDNMKDPDFEALLEAERSDRDRDEVEEFLNEKMREEKEEMREEAEEDLEMLMGTQEGGEMAEEGSGLSQLQEIKERFDERWEELTSRSEEEAEESTRDEKVLELLEDYRQLEREEAITKTAHVLKGYIEYKMGVDREMTYGELADALREADHSDEAGELADFFERMSNQQYAGRIVFDSDEVIRTAESAVQEFKA